MTEIYIYDPDQETVSNLDLDDIIHKITIKFQYNIGGSIMIYKVG